MDVGTLASVISVTVAVTGGLSTLIGMWLSRRAASGRVGTSEASVLWQQAQEMRTMLLAEKTRAEDQRDRLIEAYTSQLFPVLTQVNVTVTELTSAVAEDIRLSHEILGRQRGGEHAPSTSNGPEAGTHSA